MHQTLGDFEKAVLTAILYNENKAYGIQICKWLNEHQLYSASNSAIYVSLLRLQKKRLLISTLVAAPGDRHKKGKLFYSVNAAGKRTLLSSFSLVEALASKLRTA